MASPIQIRDVPDEVRRALKARAASRGESLNRYLLGILEREASRPSVSEVLERAARRSERATTSSVEAIQEARADREGRAGGRRPAVGRSARARPRS